MRALTRRGMLGGGLGAIGLGALGGCATPGMVSVNTQPTVSPADVPVQITYWSWLKNLDKVTAIWNEKHPDIQVKAVWIPSGNKGGYAKMYSALAAGGGPDLAQVEYRSIPEFMLVNGLVDLSRYGADQYGERFSDTLWDQVGYLDGIYGIPQDSGPMATFYQPALYEKVGAAPPTTWQDWADLARELRGVGTYLDCFPLSDASYFCSYCTQAGASWLTPTEDGWVIDMTDEITMDVARFFDGVVDEDLVNTQLPPFSPGWFAAAAEGRVASLTSGSWADALIKGVSGGKGKWKVSPMPVWGDQGYGSSYLGGSTAAVLAHSRHPKEAMEFAIWMCTSQEGLDALIEYCGIGWSPTPDYIGAERKGPSEFYSGQDYNEQIIAPAGQEQNPDWAWWPTTQQSFNILSDQFRQKAAGQSLVDGVARAQEQIIEAFRDKGLTIRKARS